MAASKATPESVAFMIRNTSGILCTPITAEHASRLHLDPMVARNDAPLATAFTVSVDYKQGLSTGIAADERANTVLALASNNTQAEDFVRPGHVFPLIGRQGGVLVRSGHTEAAIDLAEAAQCPPVGLLAEIVNDEGTVKRLPELIDFAKEHDLPLVTIDDLIAWRQQRERLIERVNEFRVDTSIGRAQAFAYRTRFEDAQHLVLVFGQINPSRPIPVRIHRERLVEDAFGPQKPHTQRLLDIALARFKEHGNGVLIYLRTGFSGVPQSQLNSGGESSAERRANQWLEVGVGAQILRDLGVTQVQLLAGREIDYVGVEGFGLVVVGTELL